MANLHSTILQLALSPDRSARVAYRMQLESGEYREVLWSEFADQALRLSSFLKSKGVGKGDRVLLISENGPEWVMLAAAVMNLEAVLVPVASIASLLEFTNTLHGAEPKLTVISLNIAISRQAEELLQAEGRPYLRWNLQDSKPLAAWISSSTAAEIHSSISSDQTALLIFTSGTTGQPKGVPISHENVLSNAKGVLQNLSASEKDRVVSVLPLSHMLEFTGGFVITALVGATVTYVRSLKSEDILKALRDSKSTILIGVPLLFEIMGRTLQSKLDSLPRPLADLFHAFGNWTKQYPFLGKVLFFPVHQALGGKLRFFVAGGSKLQAQTFEQFQRLGIPILQGYGLTETSPVLSITTLETAAPDHVGRALPGVELGIFDDSGKALPVGQEGEIWAKGPNVFKGYLNPEHSKGAFFASWFRTGDLGVIDEKGLLRITGRKKDIIVTAAGKNVYPEEIEATVLANKIFAEAAALGMEDASGHEKITLVVVPDRTKFLGKSFDTIKEECAKEASALCRSLAEYKWPQKIEVLLEELPKTSTRKVKKHEVRKLLKAKEELGKHTSAKVVEEGALDLSNELEAAVAQGLSSITSVKPEAVRLHQSLTKDLGLDSLTFVELLSHVEKKFGVQIEGVDFSTIQTVEDFLRTLQFATESKKPKGFFEKVHFANFHPLENRKFLWRLPRRIVNVLLRSTMKIRHEMKVEGLENIQDAGPFVFTPNHTSHFDLLSIVSSIPGNLLHRTFAVAAKDYFFDRTWKALGARIFVNAIPFDRKGRVDESMKACLEVLQAGGSLVIFPEGTRSPNGKLQEFKPGVGHLLAGHPNARAVPVFIDGAYEIMPKGSNFPRAGKMKIRFGKPISFAQLPADADSFKKIAKTLQEEVVALSRK